MLLLLSSLKPHGADIFDFLSILLTTPEQPGPVWDWPRIKEWRILLFMRLPWTNKEMLEERSDIKEVLKENTWWPAYIFKLLHSISTLCLSLLQVNDFFILMFSAFRYRYSYWCFIEWQYGNTIMHDFRIYNVYISFFKYFKLISCYEKCLVTYRYYPIFLLQYNPCFM